MAGASRVWDTSEEFYLTRLFRPVLLERLPFPSFPKATSTAACEYCRELLEQRSAISASSPDRKRKSYRPDSNLSSSPIFVCRSDRHRRPTISASGTDSGADAGLDSDAAERKSQRERRPSNRIVEAQETMRAAVELAEDAQPLGEVVYDDEKQGEMEQEESESEELPDAGAREDKDDDEYM
jgi:hypothetical protein